jgi:hypothetical protein
LQDHVVRALNLPVRAGVSYDGPVDMVVVFIVEPKEFLPCELRVVVGDGGVQSPKLMDNVAKEEHGLFGFNLSDRPCFYPLRELVNGDKQVRVAPGAFLRGSTRSSP